MACDVLWTESVRADVERAVGYIAKKLDSPQAAGSLLDSIEQAVDDISLSPEACPVSSYHALASRGLRKKLVKRYVLLYSYDGDTAVISRMFHTLQDYARIFG